METVVEVSNEDLLAHPYTPHMFAIPRFINHLWRRKLSKDAEVLFTINVGPSCWSRSMHEPIIVLICLPLDHVSNYRGPWVLQGISQALEVHSHLEDGFKHPELHGCGKFRDLEGPVHGVQDPKEGWSRALLFKFLEAQKTFTPVLCGLVKICYLPCPEDPIRVQTSLAAEDNKSKDLETE